VATTEMERTKKRKKNFKNKVLAHELRHTVCISWTIQGTFNGRIK